MSQDSKSCVALYQLLKMHAKGDIDTALFKQLTKNVLGYDNDRRWEARRRPAWLKARILCIVLYCGTCEARGSSYSATCMVACVAGRAAGKYTAISPPIAIQR